MNHLTKNKPKGSFRLRWMDRAQRQGVGLLRSACLLWQIWPLLCPLLEGGLADGWALISSRQTCNRKHLPSRSRKPALLQRLADSRRGRRGKEVKNNWILAFFLPRKLADFQLFTKKNMIYWPAAEELLWTNRCRELDCVCNHCTRLVLGKASHWFPTVCCLRIWTVIKARVK